MPHSHPCLRRDDPRMQLNVSASFLFALRRQGCPEAVDHVRVVLRSRPAQAGMIPTFGFSSSISRGPLARAGMDRSLNWRMRISWRRPCAGRDDPDRPFEAFIFKPSALQRQGWASHCSGHDYERYGFLAKAGMDPSSKKPFLSSASPPCNGRDEPGRHRFTWMRDHTALRKRG